MQSARRNDYEVRVEMLPLIDVVFLLLTFFIYSMVVMVRAEVLPITLNPLATGKPATPDQAQAITIDHEGNVYLNRHLVDRDTLAARLDEMAADAEQAPTLYLAMEKSGSIDRGPVLVDLIERIRAAGIHDFVLVGSPTTNGQND